ncbi:hypothetical protein [Photobacterium gaetbulicola]|uniref:hypothetical protein n=1 Tax=Photobacterium gaetbulicola TaxID=1295392 RepID=UPI000AB683CE|nr:hypothetical protein [Photobacterium gaetbulicola]
MTKSIVFLVGIFFSLTVNSASLDNSQLMIIDSIESRYSGAHAVFGSGSIPDQGCTYKDRGIIVDTDIGSNTMVSVTLSAAISATPVIIQVSGCTMISPGHGTETAPKITKVQLNLK